MTSPIRKFIRRTLSAVPGGPGLVNAARASRIVYPTTPGTLRESELFRAWWYYNIELLPGVVAMGQYEKTFPMLPRMMLRNCGIEGMKCLDMGSMEGLIPTLMARRGASRVLATDAVSHCVEKMNAIKHYYQVNFDYKSVGLMYEMNKKLPREQFDLVNCSGLLYHVVCPFTVLAGVRSLMNRNGLIIISTNVVESDECFMEFNDAGKLQDEANTFWYVSIPMMDYMVRYLRLAPIDVKYLPHAAIASHIRYRNAKSTGYMSLVCRAVDAPVPTASDDWMRVSSEGSWESVGLVDWVRAAGNAVSAIKYSGEAIGTQARSDTQTLDVMKAVRERTRVAMTEQQCDTHTLLLGDKT